MIRPVAWILTFGAWSLVACASRGTATQGHLAVQSDTPACDVAAASPWISRWLGAWELACREILRLPDAPPPNLVFYDSTCVYTTAEAALPGITSVDGPSLHGTKLPWRAAVHNDSIPLPDGSRVPIALMSFAKSDK
ncbi:MAG TPA: hypothetical protein VFT13_10780, partial [Candidatus Krumholzibacteria bacterium]|nr:hypothetical protein [Candidatus Krumholzibacteria bacterium]